MPAILCPKCEKNDAMLKISAIYRVGLTTTDYQSIAPLQVGQSTAFIPVTRQARIQTDLSLSFTPPVRDLSGTISYHGAKYPRWITFVPGWKAEVDKILMKFFLVLLIVFVVSIIAIVATGGEGRVGIIAAFAFLFIPLVYYLSLRDSWLTKNNKYETLAKNQLEAAMKRWEYGYYCDRCDVVFAEGEGNFFPVSNFQSFLWQG
jgi:hypothetical protein